MLNSKELAAIQKQLPKEAFATSPKRIVLLLLYLGVGLTCFYWAGQWKVWHITIALGVICGIAFSSITYLTHDLAHRTVLHNRTAIYYLENIFWSLFGITPTFWRRLHNQSHHAHFNTNQDTDRLFLDKEKNPATKIVARLFFPSATTIPWNPFIFLNYIFYIVLNTAKVFLRDDRQSLLAMPGKICFREGDCRLIIREFGSIIIMQLGLFALMDFSLPHFFLFSFINMCTISTIVIMYGFTQHMLQPINANSDALHGATSVIVPRYLDFLHSNISYHVEHHLFPSMNSDYFPLLSEILKERYPGTYCRIPLSEAWKLLASRQSAFVESPLPQRERPT